VTDAAALASFVPHRHRDRRDSVVACRSNADEVGARRSLVVARHVDIRIPGGAIEALEHRAVGVVHERLRPSGLDDDPVARRCLAAIAPEDEPSVLRVIRLRLVGAVAEEDDPPSVLRPNDRVETRRHGRHEREPFAMSDQVAERVEHRPGLGDVPSVCARVRVPAA
jgi:hypothetical protein